MIESPINSGKEMKWEKYNRILHVIQDTQQMNSDEDVTFTDISII